MPGTGVFEILDEDTGDRRRLDLRPPQMMIGRAAECEVCLASGIVSRRHAELLFDGEGWRVRDLGSRNGSTLNGERFADERVLRPGDELRIASFAMRYLSGDGDAAGAPNPPGLDVLTRLEGNAGADDIGPLRVLEELETPAIAADQLRTITALSRELLHTESSAARQQVLCRTLTERVVARAAAAVVELAADAPSPSPRVLAAGPAGPPSRFSSSLMQAVTSRQSAVMATSHRAAAAEFVELSVIGQVEESVVIGCPLGGDADRPRLLYLSAPGAFAAVEWLALVDLAAEQYMVAESAWLARIAAQEKAVLEVELEQARSLQMRWVPDGFAIAGLDVEFGFEASRWVGGDYVDGLPLPDGRLLVSVMDVCGKGMQAALVANGLHTAIHLLAARRLEIVELVGLLNRHLISTLPPASFVTLALAAIDPSSGELEAIHCGHPPMLVSAAGGEVRAVAVREALPLGVLDFEIESVRDRLATGEVLFGYSDGVTETFDSERRMLGVDGLRDLLGGVVAEALALGSGGRSGGRSPVSTVGQRIRDHLRERRQGAALDDDVSFFLAHKTREPAAGH